MCCVLGIDLSREDIKNGYEMMFILEVVLGVVGEVVI